MADVDERYRLGHEVNAMRATLKRTGAVDLGNGITLRIIRDELHGNVTADMTSA